MESELPLVAGQSEKATQPNPAPKCRRAKLWACMQRDGIFSPPKFQKTQR